MKSRSPVLGYNHNVRYAGRLWHVQTEDSGVNNPHIFTHLFHDGTILATKRIDYDPANEVAAVQKLMQTQHKAMLRELKAGAFDEKIGKFFGEPVVKDKEEESTDPNAQPPIAVDLPGTTLPLPVDEANALIERTRTTEHKPISRPQVARTTDHDTLPPTAPPAVPKAPPPAQTLPRIAPSTQPRQPMAAAATAPKPAAAPPRTGGYTGGIGRRPQPGAAAAKPAEGVVVSRPAVVIGGEAQPARPSPTRPGAGSSTRWHAPTAPQTQPPATRKPSSSSNLSPPSQDNIFGGDLISEKSLDEVILAYLSEDLNEK